MAEIITRCQEGKLTVNDDMIKVALGEWKTRSMPRAMLVGIDSKLVMPPIFGLGGSVTLVFRGQGSEVIKAGWVPIKDARAIKAMLGY